MGLEIAQWLSQLKEELIAAFGQRLVFIGHTGSHARGEATEESDIDVNIVLDEAAFEDLQLYRAIIRRMPNKEKACGFICGVKEIQAWPAHELFSFIQGCITLYGGLDKLIEFPADKDIMDNIKNSASGIYHEVCHRYIYCEHIAKEVHHLKPAFKAAFFVLQEWVYLRQRVYIPTKRELLSQLHGLNAEILNTLINWDSLKNDRENHAELYFSKLKEWSSLMMQGTSE